MYFQVPAEVDFFGVGGMKVDSYPENLFKKMMEGRPDYVFLTIGGNDITSQTSPKKIAEKLQALADRMLKDGVKKVFFTEITERGKFRKDRRLTKKSFNAQRSKINDTLKRQFDVVPMDVRFPRHYSSDEVHLNEEGNRKYFFAVRGVVFALRA